MITNIRRQTESYGYLASIRSSFLLSGRAEFGAETYVEVIGYLFSMFWPLTVVSIAYIGLSLVAYHETGSVFIAALGLIGSGVALARLGLLFLFRRLPREMRRRSEIVEIWERRYAIGAYVFAACLGLLEAKLFLTEGADTALLGVAVLYGYGAGLVARICMRPRISVVSLLIAALPAIAAMIMRANFAYVSLAICSMIFLFAGFETIFHIYRGIMTRETMRHEFAVLACQDQLTGLPNRLQMRETLRQEIARIGRYGGLLAVHYLDLDRFKTANDRFGHPVGDTLLKMVAHRLQSLMRAGDVVARLGGDEFLVIQTGITHASEAEVLAMRIIRVIGRPFEIDGKAINTETSIGIALAPTDSMDMAALVKYADIALYTAKARASSSYCFYGDPARSGVGDAGIDCNGQSAASSGSMSA